MADILRIALAASKVSVASQPEVFWAKNFGTWQA
jgi:hypothetical protein